MNERSPGNRCLRNRSLAPPPNNGKTVLSTASTSSSPGLDPQLWHACAGCMVRLPTVGARVFYFPQGHADHAASPPDFPPSVGLSSTVPCKVLAVDLLADAETDEVYARIHLLPDLSLATKSGHSDDDPPSPPPSERLTSFAKTLTQSDANNGGGFSVPRYCAETIFPRLDYNSDPPLQIVHARDVHGTVWEFRHIYRGTPRRHLLTTGWSNFVNEKKLVAGDAIVFLRNNRGELCVGVRRSTKAAGGKGLPSWTSCTVGVQPWEQKPADTSLDLLGSTEGGRKACNSSNNFTRNKARVTAKSVIEAAILAVAGQPFEVVYYPQATMSEFCVKARTVEIALRQSWAPGMRFKMAMETEDASRISWFMGTVAKVQEADPARWPNSPWKTLQVTWEEPDLLQGIVRLSPWQVELVSPMQSTPFLIPMKKRSRTSQTTDLQLDGFAVQGRPMAALCNMGQINAQFDVSGVQGLLMTVLANTGQSNPCHGFVDSSVNTGMQGVRHDDNFGLGFCDMQRNVFQPGVYLDSNYPHRGQFCTVDVTVSTELTMSNMGKESYQGRIPNLLIGEDTPSSSEPASSSSAVNLDQYRSSSKKGASFILFGKMINTSQSGKAQPMELSGSSSDWPEPETTSDSNQSELVCKLQDNLWVETQSLSLPQRSSTDSTNEVEPLNLF